MWANSLISGSCDISLAISMSSINEFNSFPAADDDTPEDDLKDLVVLDEENEIDL